MFAYSTDQRSACCSSLIVERPHTDCFAGYMPSFACYRCNHGVPHPRARGLMGFEPPRFYEHSFVRGRTEHMAFFDDLTFVDLILAVQPMTDPPAELEFRVIKKRAANE